jgi:hypothetical protein
MNNRAVLSADRFLHQRILWGIGSLLGEIERRRHLDARRALRTKGARSSTNKITNDAR